MLPVASVAERLLKLGGCAPGCGRACPALAEDDNSEECAILCESGARPGGYGLLVKCCAMSLFERS